MQKVLDVIPESESDTLIRYSEGSRQNFHRETQELIDRLTIKVKKDRHAIDDYILLGRLYRIRGESKRAVRIHRNLLVRDELPRTTKAVLCLEMGLDLLDLKIQDFGESYFLQALEIQKHHVAAMENLVRSFELQGKYELAIEYLRRLLRLGRPQKTHLAFVYSALAARYLERGVAAKALRAVRRAILLDRKCLYPQLILSDVYTEGKRYSKAILILSETIEQWPPYSFLILRRLEDVHYRMRRFPDYENTLRDLIRNSPENFYIHYSLARHLRKKKRNSDALTALRRCLEINPLYVNAIKDRMELCPSTDEYGEIKKFTANFFAGLKKSRRFICPNCRHRYELLRWRCEQCGEWGTFEVRYELPAP